MRSGTRDPDTAKEVFNEGDQPTRKMCFLINELERERAQASRILHFVIDYNQGCCQMSEGQKYSPLNKANCFLPRCVSIGNYIANTTSCKFLADKVFFITFILNVKLS